MAEEVTLEALLNFEGVEVLDITQVPTGTSEADRTLTHNGFGVDVQLTGITTPAVAKIVSEEITLGGSAYTIDLTAAKLSSGRTEDLTGLKLVGYAFLADVDNAAMVTVKPATSNGYHLFGTSNELDLLIGQVAFNFLQSGGHPAVSSTVKEIEVSGTSGDKVKYILFLG